jgi:hypothetical protein
MKLIKGWKITLSTGDAITIPNSDTGTLRWAKRKKATIKRIFILH